MRSNGNGFYVEHLTTCRGDYCDAAYQCDRLSRRTARMEADRSRSARRSETIVEAERVQSELDGYARKRRAWGRGRMA